MRRENTLKQYTLMLSMVTESSIVEKQRPNSPSIYAGVNLEYSRELTNGVTLDLLWCKITKFDPQCFIYMINI